MGVQVSVVTPGAVEADVLAVPVVEPGEPPANGVLDERLHGRLAALVAAGEVSGELGETCVVHVENGAGAARVAAAGLGPKTAVDPDAVRTAAGAVARAASRFGGSVAWLLDPALDLPPAEQARAVVEGVLLGAYEPGRWKTNRRRPRPIERIVLVGDGPGVSEAAARAERVAEWTNRARDLANAPGNELTPERLAARAAEIADGSDHLSAEALGPEGIDELGVPLEVVSVVAACENLTGGGAYRPGDILTAMNGKTIEVVNTDAEGRLVLADALCYAREQGATHLLDLATLTGAMELALGDLYAGVFANDEAWRDQVVEAGEA